jgi:cytochrome c biogenesis protein CcmG/thiol:disulfide interchange protein DsbE
MGEPATSGAPQQSRRWLVTLPLIGFIALAGLFLLRLHGGDPSKIPSALIGRPAPQTALPALEARMARDPLDPPPSRAGVSSRGLVRASRRGAYYLNVLATAAPQMVGIHKDCRIMPSGRARRGESVRHGRRRWQRPWLTNGVPGTPRPCGRPEGLSLQDIAGDDGQSQRAQGRD